MDMIHNLELPNAITDWHWCTISENIQISEVYKYPYETWNRKGLSCNKGISIDLIHNLELPRAIQLWDWCCISQNLPIVYIYRYPDESWDRGGLSQNKDLTIDDIYRLDHKPRIDYRRYVISFSDVVIV